jgi:hypothetical protein
VESVPKPQSKTTVKAMEDSKRISADSSKKKPADMLSYGWANNNPTVPQHFMKTFNVTVPKSEVKQSISQSSRLFHGRMSG